MQVRFLILCFVAKCTHTVRDDSVAKDTFNEARQKISQEDEHKDPTSDTPMNVQVNVDVSFTPPISSIFPAVGNLVSADGIRAGKKTNQGNHEARLTQVVTRFASWNVLASMPTSWLFKIKENYPPPERKKETDEERILRNEKANAIITEYHAQFDAVMLQELDGCLVERLWRGPHGLLQTCQSCVLFWNPSLLMSPTPASDEACKTRFYVRVSGGDDQLHVIPTNESCVTRKQVRSLDPESQADVKFFYNRKSGVAKKCNFGTGLILTNSEYVDEERVEISQRVGAGKGWIAVRTRDMSKSVEWVVSMHADGWYSREGNRFTDSTLYEELTNALGDSRAIVGVDTNSGPLNDQCVEKHAFGNNFAPLGLVWSDKDYWQEYSKLEGNIDQDTSDAVAAFCDKDPKWKKQYGKPLHDKAEVAVVSLLSQYFDSEIYSLHKASQAMGACTAQSWRQDLTLLILSAKMYREWKPERTACGPKGWITPEFVDRFLLSDSLMQYLDRKQASVQPKTELVKGIAWKSPWLAINDHDPDMWPSDHAMIQISF